MIEEIWCHMTTKDGHGIATQAQVEDCTLVREGGCTSAEEADIHPARGRAIYPTWGRLIYASRGRALHTEWRRLIYAPRGRPFYPAWGRALYRILPEPIPQQYTAKRSILGVPADPRLRSRVPYPERRMGSLEGRARFIKSSATSLSKATSRPSPSTPRKSHDPRPSEPGFLIPESSP